MISHRHKCIFVHIPKCGGTSIEEIIWPGKRDESELWMGFTSQYYNKYQTGGLQHLFAEHIRQEVGTDIFSAYFKFSIVRNPWDRARSQYLSMGRRPDLRAFVGMKANDSFKTYLRLIAENTHVQWEAQHKFIFDKQGTLLVDHVGKFEHFNEEVKRILERLGIRSAIPHLNAAPARERRPLYDEETVHIVAGLYGRDIELFNYANFAPLVY